MLSEMAPEMTAQSSVCSGLSSTWTVRAPPLRLMPFMKVVTAVDCAELSFRVPMMPEPTPEPQFNVPVVPPMLTFIAELLPAAKPPPLAVHSNLPLPLVPSDRLNTTALLHIRIPPSNTRKLAVGSPWLESA